MAPEELLEQKQAEKQEVKGYFETTGFDRWNRIYSESDNVNKVQRNIRIGHQKTVDEVLAWIKESGELNNASFCDAGCGVGSLSLPLAAMGAGSIQASDISEAMAQEAERRARDAGLDMAKLNFFASDLESLNGSFHTVCCLDVFIHYPQKPAEDMVKHLCGLTEQRLIVRALRCWRSSRGNDPHGATASDPYSFGSTGQPVAGRSVVSAQSWDF